MSLARVKLAIDKFKEEAEETKLYQEWMSEQADYGADRSLWGNIGKAAGFLLGSGLKLWNPAAGFLIGGMLGQAGGRLAHGKGLEAIDFGGKFDTQGERDAEFAMEQAEWGTAEEMEMGMSTLMQFIQMGGDFSDLGIGAKGSGGSGGGGQSTTSTGILSGDMDLATAVGLGTGAFTSMVHSGAYGDAEYATATSSEPGTSTTDTTPTYDDNTTDEAADEEHRQWLASMGITSPLYNNSGNV